MLDHEALDAFRLDDMTREPLMVAPRRDHQRAAAQLALSLLLAAGMSQDEATDRAPFVAAVLAWSWKRCPGCKRWARRRGKPSRPTGEGECPACMRRRRRESNARAAIRRKAVRS